ncbi:MAG: hypothetical protein ISS74_02560 [Planctomycetes bacterium]|nr:hypothetical protein [Planctomycetota bacterium]
MRYLALTLLLVFVSAFIVGCKGEEPAAKTCPTCGAVLAPDGTCPKCAAKEAGEGAGEAAKDMGEAVKETAEDAAKKAEETADDATKAIEGALKGADEM